MIHPVGYRVLVKELEKKNQSESGLILAPTAEAVEKFGEVVDCGEGKLLADGTIKEFAITAGDKIMFTQRGAFEFSYRGEKFFLIDGDYILAIVD